MNEYPRPLLRWLDEHFLARHIAWYAKYLSGHDTQAIRGNHASPYIQRDVLLKALPALRSRVLTKNPRISLELHIDSHDYHRDRIKAVWYNDRLHGGTRDEVRLTGLRGSPLLDPENTGSLTLFLFHLAKKGRKRACRVWITRSAAEYDLITDCIGPVEPEFPEFSVPGISPRMKTLICLSELRSFYDRLQTNPE